MKRKYEQPEVELVKFEVVETLMDGTHLPGTSGFEEGVEDGSQYD